MNKRHLFKRLIPITLVAAVAVAGAAYVPHVIGDERKPISLAVYLRDQGMRITLDHLDLSQEARPLGLLEGKSYEAYELTIVNPTAKEFHLATDSVNLPTKSPGDLVSSLRGAAIARGLVLSAVGFIFFPLGILGMAHSIGVMKKEARLRDEFNALGMKEENEKILPYSAVRRSIVIDPEDKKEHVTITIKDLDEDRPVSFIGTVKEDEPHTVLEPLDSQEEPPNHFA